MHAVIIRSIATVSIVLSGLAFLPALTFAAPNCNLKRDLTGADLSGCDLTGADLHGANLSFSNCSVLTSRMRA